MASALLIVSAIGILWYIFKYAISSLPGRSPISLTSAVGPVGLSVLCTGGGVLLILYGDCRPRLEACGLGLALTGGAGLIADLFYDGRDKGWRRRGRVSPGSACNAAALLYVIGAALDPADETQCAAAAANAGMAVLLLACAYCAA